jgi:hypothetical protein
LRTNQLEVGIRGSPPSQHDQTPPISLLQIIAGGLNPIFGPTVSGCNNVVGIGAQAEWLGFGIVVFGD